MENDTLKVEDQGLFGMVDLHPIIFEEAYVKDGDPKFVQLVKNYTEVYTEEQMLAFDGKKQPRQLIGVHLFILCHGFQGNSGDMRLLKNNLSLTHPEAIFLSSQANEDLTEGDIFEMGERLANEVKQYIQAFCPIQCLSKVSFIGHSLGGLIIRAALPHLEGELKDKFFTYMSLSSPHMGYMYNSSKLFDAGMWFLKKWRKSKCLLQLSMTDSKNIEEAALFRLSKASGLQHFKNIVLVSSYQDQYAPFDSARIQICKKAVDDSSRKGNYYTTMVQNLMGGLKARVMYRLDVNFKINDK
jgi:predicted alpha/beta hydrolase family esterase